MHNDECMHKCITLHLNSYGRSENKNDYAKVKRKIHPCTQIYLCIYYVFDFPLLRTLHVVDIKSASGETSQSVFTDNISIF